MKKIWVQVFVLLILVIIIGAVLAVAKKDTGQLNNPSAGGIPSGVACTMEAKLCPDGSYVGRSGPRCEFAACPVATSTPSTGGSPSQGILPYDSGVQGVVMVGPTCPVMKNPPDAQCADKPYQTMVAVFRKSDPVHAYAIAKSAADGTFRFSLPPGDYTLGAGESNLPRCDHPEATVGPSGYTQVTISCDSGIR
jgi:hypothetical protein